MRVEVTIALVQWDTWHLIKDIFADSETCIMYAPQIIQCWAETLKARFEHPMHEAWKLRFMRCIDGVEIIKVYVKVSALVE